MEFSLFPPLEALQAAEFQIARQRRLDSPPNPVFFECVSMFLQWFPSKHGALHFCRHKTRSKTSCSTMLPIPLSPQPLKIPLFTVFSSIFPCSNAGSQLQHIYKKSFQNIVFDSVCPMFPVKQTVIYTFFAIKAVNPSETLLLTVFFLLMLPVKHTVIYHVFCYNVSPKHLFLQCFQCSGIQKPCKILLCTMFFFHFWPFFHCRQATKMTQNSISIPSCAQTPKNPRKMSKTPPYSGLGAKPFLAPPPQLKLI